jgi:hypothetical protein
MQQLFEYEVYLSLRGQFDPDKITSDLGLEPSYSVKKGDKGRYTQSAKSGIWNYSTGRKKSEQPHLTMEVEELILRLSDVECILRKIVASDDVFCVLQVFLSLPNDIDVDQMSMPGVALDRKSLSFLARIGAEFDIDMN